MTTNSAVFDGKMVNGFDFAKASGLSGENEKLLQRRLNVLGSIYPLFYGTPLHIRSAKGTRITDASGVEYLDVYNNVPCVGHSNPHVAEKVSKQLTIMNTHTRYLQDEIVDYSERLVATMPDHLDRVIFSNSGSEANDLAIQIARKLTGNQGVIVTTRAYHGTTDLLAGLSPDNGSQTPIDLTVRTVAAPDEYRVDAENLEDWWAAQVEEKIEELRRYGIGVAAILVDTIFSSDGVFTHPVGVLNKAFKLVREAGGLVIADEVQPGMARTGEHMWGFMRHTEEVDIISTGKPIANGLPMGVIGLTSDLSDSFAARHRYFNTFGGNPASIAAASAVLDEIEDKELLANAVSVGNKMKSGIEEFAQKFSRIGHVRGAGLFVGVEFVKDRETKTPDAALAFDFVTRMKEKQVLISATGPMGNVLKIRPPLVFNTDDCDEFLTKFNESLIELSDQ